MRKRGASFQACRFVYGKLGSLPHVEGKQLSRDTELVIIYTKPSSRDGTSLDATMGCRLRPVCRQDQLGGEKVSIVRVGLAETKKFAEGYDAISGKKKAKNAAAAEPAKAEAKKAAPPKKKAKKK